MQSMKAEGALLELEELKRVPDLSSLEFEPVEELENLTFSSHAWTITVDPVSGNAVPSKLPNCSTYCLPHYSSVPHLDYLLKFTVACTKHHGTHLSALIWLTRVN